MKLYYNRPSPYARKVLVTAHETGLIDRIELRESDPWKDPPDLLSATPLAKVPALVTEEGTLLTESASICEYLDGLTGRGLTKGDRLPVMARAALAQGLIDAAFGTVIERRRPAERQWGEWIDRQRRAIDRTLTRIVPAGERFDLGDVALACGLAYLDFRLPEIAWRTQHRPLAAWLDEANRRPSMQATKP
jgi:glutathione S-transferase